MKRLAAFLLLAGIVPIPLLASDYFTTRRSLFQSDTPTEATAMVPIIPTAKTEMPKQAPTKKAAPNAKEFVVKIPDPDMEVSKKTPTKKPETKPTTAKVTKPVPVAEPTKAVVQASGTASTPRTSTSYMKSLFTSDSSSAVWVGQTAVPSQLSGVSVYAVPPQPPVEALPVATTKPTKKAATAAPTTPATKTTVVADAPIPTRPMIPAPTVASMSLPPGTVIQPVESQVVDMPAQPVARTLSPMRQPTPTPATVHHATVASMPLPTGFKLVGGESPQGPYSGFTLAQAQPAPVAQPAQPAPVPQPAPAPVQERGPFTGYNGSGCCPTCGAGPRESSGIFSGRLLSWVCFKPTTRDALPRFQPLPYVTPIIAFRCDGSGCGAGSYGGGCSTGNCGTGNCASSNNGNNGNNGNGNCVNGNCASGGVAGRFGFGDRGCKSGCVPPADNVFPGYQFTTGPALIGGPYQGNGYTSYKPAAQPVPAPVAPPVVQTSGGYYKPVYATDSGVKPASGDVLARPFTRP